MKIRNAQLSDIDRVHQIEKESFIESVQDSIEVIEKRFRIYPEGMFVVERDHLVAGCIITACINDLELVTSNDLKNMALHDANGKLLVVLSVMVSKCCHGKGYGTAMMKHVIKYARFHKKSAVVLMCREHLIPYYRKLNFKLLKKSSSDKGGVVWFEMIQKLNHEVVDASRKSHVGIPHRR